MPKFETRLTPALIERYTRSGHWGTETFYSVLARRAAAHPDRVAIVDHRSRVTYAELLRRVDDVAAGLADIGVGLGDVVMSQELRPRLPDLRSVCVLGGEPTPNTTRLDDLIDGKRRVADFTPVQMA